MTAALDTDGFVAATNVSRETLARLETHLALLRRWQRRINLVGPTTLDDPWRRHVLDSAQLLPLLPPGPFLDVGSGAGFPGLVLAAMGAGPAHLVESDARKAAFLAEAARAAGIAVRLHRCRIEDLAPFPVATVTARALAPLSRLLDWAAPFFEANPAVVGLFPKGAGVDDELTAAAKDWMMEIERHPSVTDPSATILIVRTLRRGRIRA